MRFFTPIPCVAALTAIFCAGPAMAGPGGISSAEAEAYWHFLGTFHAAVAHFPIALLMLAGLIELFRLVRPGRGDRVPGDATIVCLWVGMLGAVLTTTLGWANADAAGEFNGSLKQVVAFHRWSAVAVAAVAVMAVALATVARRHRSPGRGLVLASRGTAVLAAVLVGAVGMYGGKLTHGVDHYADAYDDLVAALDRADEPVDPQLVAGGRPAELHPSPSAAPPAVIPQETTTEPVEAAAESSPDPATPIGTDAVVPPADAAGLAAEPVGQDPVDADPVQATAPALDPGSGVTDPKPAITVSFATQVKPILVATCVKCHYEKKEKAGYRLDTREMAMRMGDSEEETIIPGKSGDSLLIKVVKGEGFYEDSIMPPKGTLLTPEQIELIARWIDEGAVWEGGPLVPADP